MGISPNVFDGIKIQKICSVTIGYWWRYHWVLWNDYVIMPSYAVDDDMTSLRRHLWIFFHDLPIRVKNNRTAKIDLKIDPKWPGLTWGFLCAWAFWRFVRRLNVFGQLLRWAISSRKGHDWFQIVGWELTAFQFWHWPTYTQHRYLLIREDRDFEFINYKRAHAKKK